MSAFSKTFLVKCKTKSFFTRPPCEIKRKYYITDCAGEVYDEIWKERCALELAYKSTDNQVVWTEIDEKTLVSHAALACIGIQSECFYFDQVRYLLVHWCCSSFFNTYLIILLLGLHLYMLLT